jgi:hypothetical protein
MSQLIFLEKIKTHVLCSITFFLNSCHLWDNVEKYGGDRETICKNIIPRMRFACWINKTTDTHSEYLTLIDFPRQKYFRKGALPLRNRYIASLVVSSLRSSLYLFSLCFFTSFPSFSQDKKVVCYKDQTKIFDYSLSYHFTPLPHHKTERTASNESCRWNYVYLYSGILISFLLYWIRPLLHLSRSPLFSLLHTSLRFAFLEIRLTS